MSKPLLTRRSFLFGSAALAVLGSTGGYATLVEPFWLKVRNVRMPLENLPEPWVGRRVCQLSDLHVCPKMPLEHIRAAFDQVRALDPDLVLYTGDFVTRGPGTFELLDQLKGEFPRGRAGTFGVLGNHDYGADWKNVKWSKKVVVFAAQNGIAILLNHSVVIDGLQIAGVEDLWSGRFSPAQALRHSDPGAATIMMCHNPDGVDMPGWGAYRGWIVAGHTHGGQCQPPFLPPPLLPVRNRRYTAGLFDLGNGRTMYINRGVGYLHRVRFNVRPEITVFTLARVSS